MTDGHHTSSPEMPIFTRTYDLLTWLLPATNHFPRAHRQTVTHRLLDAAFDLCERLEEANLRQGAARMERLALADETLAHVRLYLQERQVTPQRTVHAPVGMPGLFDPAHGASPATSPAGVGSVLQYWTGRATPQEEP